MFFTSLTEWSFQNILLRMLTALILGGLIGIDRGAKKRGGGARTDAAVSLGAAMVMMTAQYMDLRFPGNIDISRMAAQVVSGVGFLGAGSILVSGRQVKGLTSAAGIWICACVGLAAGIGFVDGAFLVTAVLLVGIHLLQLIEEKVHQYSRYVRLYVIVEEEQAVPVLLSRLKRDGCKIDMYDMDKPKADSWSVTLLMTIRIPWRLQKEEYLEEMTEIDGVKFVHIMD